MVPANRQLLWTALLLPCAAAGALVPSLAALAVGGYAVLLLLALADAWLSRGVLRGLAVTLPEVVRLTQDRDGGFAVRIRCGPAGRALVVGLPLPAEVGAARDTLAVVLAGDAPEHTVTWPCRPRARGRYTLDGACLETASRLGFWRMRGTVPCRGEFRVYPNLMAERQELAAIFLNRDTTGVHAQRLLGHGREFEKLREYLPGDSYDEIHWKATAKRGRPVTKLYQVERTQEIYVALDASRLSRRAAGAKPALERFINAALVLGLAAEKQGDLFGLIVFNDRVRRFVRAANGKAHFDTCRDALYTVAPEIVTPDFAELFTQVRLKLRRRALVLLLTDLSDPLLAERFRASVPLVARQHLIMVNMFPQPGAQPLFQQPDATATDDLYRRLGGQLVWQSLRELGRGLQHLGVTLTLVEQDRLCVELVSQYMRVKQRQAL